MAWGSSAGTITAPSGTVGWGPESPSIEPPHGTAWTGIKKIDVPVMAATATIATPVGQSGVRVEIPSTGPALPLELPFPLGMYASMHANAHMPEALMGNGAQTVSPPVMAANADIVDPAVGSGYVVEVLASNTLPVGLPFPLGPTASMYARASLIDPTRNMTASIPRMEASSAMAVPTPATPVGYEIEVPVMRVTGTGGDPLPNPLPFPLVLPQGMLVPVVISSALLTAARMAASAAALAPTATSGVVVVSPRMGSVAAVPTPTVTTQVAIAAPRMAATPAGLYVPTAAWTKNPETTTYNTSGSFDVSAARAAGFTHLVLVGIGGGEAGTSGSVITGQGGKAGTWNSVILDLSLYPSLTTITVTRGNGGASSGGDGTATTFAGNAGSGMATLTCAGGSGNTGILAGQNAGNTTVDGDTYVGGNSSVTAGTAGSPPGAGGAGGKFFGAGGAGAVGAGYIKARRTV